MESGYTIINTIADNWPVILASVVVVGIVGLMVKAIDWAREIDDEEKWRL